MIKEIHKITNRLVDLNLLIHKEIFSPKDLLILENALKSIIIIKKDINSLLQTASLIPVENTNALVTILTKISNLLSIQAVAINEISALSVNLIRNYREKWEIIQKNIS